MFYSGLWLRPLKNKWRFSPNHLKAHGFVNYAFLQTIQIQRSCCCYCWASTCEICSVNSIGYIGVRCFFQNSQFANFSVCFFLGMEGSLLSRKLGETMPCNFALLSSKTHGMVPKRTPPRTVIRKNIGARDTGVFLYVCIFSYIFLLFLQFFLGF